MPSDSRTAGDPADARPGRVLSGRYRLRRVLARGGMATVWEAGDERLGRLVAVKILYPHLAADSGFLERFRREALSAARLHNPNVVQVFDSGFDRGQYFIVMELLAGGSLRNLMSRRKPTPQDAAIAGVATAKALAYAHSQGIIHRDIKPANILLSAEGHLKVGDFGIAKAQEHDELTSTRDVIGTAAYLSPEQLRGETPVPASDIYSLGVVLFELLAGKRPFAKDADIASAIARLTQPSPQLGAVRPGLPAGLAAIVDRCLIGDLKDRYSSAAELAARLEPFAGGRTELDLPPSREPPPGPDSRAGRGGDSPPVGAGHTSQSRRQTLVRPGPVPPPPGAAPGGGTRPAARPRGPSPRPLPPPPPALTPRPKRRRALKTIVLLLVIGLLAGGGVVVGKRLVEQGSIPGLPWQRTPGATVIDVRSFDPLGDGLESESQVRFSRDGDRSTAWVTERYRSADLGGLKAGVGLLFRFDRKASCGSVTVHTTSSGWSAGVRVGDGAAGSVDAYRVAGRIEGASSDQRIGTGSASGEYWLLWFTLLPPGSGGYRLEVTEVEFGVCD